ncbi:MAG: phosphohydrolase, partial [Sphingomonadales bacterium]|nr:phosphohydrolase [Sphingomonadales bacterium]
YFGPAVTEPVRLHVAAKRYLCAIDPGYRERLSAASELSLQLQGGPFDATQTAAFERHPHFADALRLRRFDDAAKRADWAVPPLEAYRPLLRRLLTA